MRRLAMGVGMLLLGVDVQTTTRDARGEFSEGLYLHGGSIAATVFAICLVVVLWRTLDDLPGALSGPRRPPGPVRSGYEFLWLPGLLAACLQVRWAGSEVVPGTGGVRRTEFRYGYAGHDEAGVWALVLFVLLMLALKLRAVLRPAESTPSTRAPAA